MPRIVGAFKISTRPPFAAHGLRGQPAGSCDRVNARSELSVIGMRVSAEGPVTLPIDGTLRCTKKSAVCDVSSTSTPSAGWSAVRKSPASVVFARTASLEKRFPSHETPRPRIGGEVNV